MITAISESVVLLLIKLCHNSFQYYLFRCGNGKKILEKNKKLSFIRNVFC